MVPPEGGSVEDQAHVDGRGLDGAQPAVLHDDVLEEEEQRHRHSCLREQLGDRWEDAHEVPDLARLISVKATL
eukprot:15720512-Heterocapsa_arctica.AAC.1